MSKSFAAAVKDIAADTAPAPVNPAPIPTPGPMPVAHAEPAPVVAPLPVGDGGFTGQVDKADLIIPRISVVQKVGDLSEQFPPGTIILNKRLVLAPLGESLVVTVVRARKYFMEALPFGDERRPRMFDTHEAVAAAGLTLAPKWQTGVDPTAKPCLDIVLAIHGQAGKDTAPEFSFHHDGKRYALALWAIGSPSAYNAVAKPLLSAKQLYLKSFVEQSWTLSVSREKFGTNTVFVPKVVPLATNPDALKAYLDSIV